MDLENKCILCSSKDLDIIKSINLQKLSRLYKFRRRLNIEQYFDKLSKIDQIQCHSCGLIYYNPALQGDGVFYSKIQDEGYYLLDKQEYREASNFIQLQDKVLDIGCGVGNFSKLIKSKNYTGLEFNTKAIEIAKANDIRVLNESIEAHSTSFTEYYDIVCYFQVLEHVENPQKFIESSLNCLKKGGKLIFAVPSEDSYCGTIVNNYLNYPPHHVSRWPDVTFNNVAEIFNLILDNVIHEEIHSSHASFYVRTLIFNKLRRFLGLEIGVLDIGITSTILYVISYGIGFITKPFYYFFKKKSPFGQSVITVYTKE